MAKRKHLSEYTKQILIAIKKNIIPNNNLLDDDLR